MYKSSVDLIRLDSFQQKRNRKKRLSVCQPSRIISAVRTQSSEWTEGFIIPNRSRPVRGKDNYDIEQTGCEVISKYDLEIKINKHTLLFSLLCPYTKITDTEVRNTGIFLHPPQKVTKLYHTVIHTEMNNYTSHAEWLIKEAIAVYTSQIVCSTFLFQGAQKPPFSYCIHFPS